MGYEGGSGEYIEDEGTGHLRQSTMALSALTITGVHRCQVRWNRESWKHWSS